MTPSEIWRRIWYFLNRNAVTRDLEEEMRLHVQFRADSLRQLASINDHPPEPITSARTTVNDPAFHASQRRFGNTTTIQDRSRDMWGFGNLEALTGDIRFAARRLLKRPAFALGIIAVMAIGIGAVTAMFSAVDAAMLRPLPFKAPEQLFATAAYPVPFDVGRSRRGGRAEMPSIIDLRDMNDVVSDAAAYASGAFNLVDDEQPMRVTAGVVTANFFRTLGVNPIKGRGFTDAEEVVGAQNVVVLSYGLWQRQYGGRDIGGLRITMGARQFEVIGVMPRGFSFPGESDVWIPMSVPNTFATFDAFRGEIAAVTVVRTAPGVTRDAARGQTLARMEQWFAALDEPTQKKYAERIAEFRTTGVLVPLQQRLVGDRATGLYVLLGATALLLLIACVNVTNLLLSEATARTREFALRGVLGATRMRLVRQLLTESVLLSALGAALGILLAPIALQMIRALMPTALAGVAAADLNLRVLAFAALAAVLTGLAFGVGPAFRSTANGENDLLKGGGHGATAGRAGRTRRILVAAEMALTVVLLVGAGLMLRTFSEVMRQDSGVQIANVGTLELALPTVGVSSSTRMRNLKEMLTVLQATPGIQAVGAVNDLPLLGSSYLSATKTDGPPPADGTEQFARWLSATPDYFRTVGITVLRGRTFTMADDSLAPKVVVVSRAMSEVFWPGMDPIGRTVMFGPSKMTVIGVVSGVRERRLEEEAMPQLYQPMLASTPSSIAIVARGTLPPKVLLARMTEAVRKVDRSQAVYNVRTLDEVLDASVLRRRTNALLIGMFAALALILAAVGVYAVVSFGVSTRSRELGIRSALGATGAELMGMISREMVWVTLAGLGTGLAGAWALARTAESLVYGITVHDTVTFVVVPLALLLPVVLATVVPARRATRVDPAQVMRVE